MKYSWLLLILIIWSCKKDKPPVKPIDDNQNLITDTNTRIIISNEGTFGFGNASISVYNPTLKTGIKDVYKTANNQPLGDVLQSLYFLNNKIYCVVNNSNKIEILDNKTFKRTGTITGLTSPRYFLPVSSSRAYVTDLYANAISIIDLENNTKVGSIPCKGWTEQLIMINNKVFVTNYRSNYLYVINPNVHQITDSILISKGALSLTFDNQNTLWVGCSSDEFNNISGAIYGINTNTNTVTYSYTPLGYNFSARDIYFDNSSGKIYYLNKGLQAFNALTPNLPGQSIITFGNRIIYGFAPGPNGKQIYLCDAKDYVQAGQILIYDLNQNTFADSFSVGTIPNQVYFK